MFYLMFLLESMNFPELCSFHAGVGLEVLHDQILLVLHLTLLNVQFLNISITWIICL